jgi:ATP-dependent RNA helicase DeaD
VNYQLPDEIETYTHRSGRTGRAGKLGTSIVIVTKSELRKISSIERIIKQKIEEKQFLQESKSAKTIIALSK